MPSSWIIFEAVVSFINLYPELNINSKQNRVEDCLSIENNIGNNNSTRAKQNNKRDKKKRCTRTKQTNIASRSENWNTSLVTKQEYYLTSPLSYVKKHT